MSFQLKKGMTVYDSNRKIKGPCEITDAVAERVGLTKKKVTTNDGGKSPGKSRG